MRNFIDDEQASLPENWRTQVIPVIGEELNVSKVDIETGSIRVTKTVVEEPAPYSVNLQSERLEIKTVPFNTTIKGTAPATRQEGNTTIISVVKEVLVMEKRLMLVEEIHITRVRESHIESGTVTVNTEVAEVTRSTNEL